MPDDAEVVDGRWRGWCPGSSTRTCTSALGGGRGLGGHGRQRDDRPGRRRTCAPSTPSTREDQGFKDALAGGVTTVMVDPGSANIIGGQAVAREVLRPHVDEMVRAQARRPQGRAWREPQAGLRRSEEDAVDQDRRRPLVLRERHRRPQTYHAKVAAARASRSSATWHRGPGKVLDREIPCACTPTAPTTS